MRFLAILAFFSCSCPKPIPAPTPPTPDEVGLPSCTSDASVDIADSCDGLFTESGLACVHCGGASACLNEQLMVYCVQDSCLDPECMYESQYATRRAK